MARKFILPFILLFFFASCSKELSEKESLGNEALLYAKETFYNELTAPLGKGPKALQFVKYLEINTIWKIRSVDITTTDRKRAVVVLSYESFKRDLLDAMVLELRESSGQTWNETLSLMAEKKEYKGVISSSSSRYTYMIRVDYSALSGRLQPIRFTVR